MESHASSTPQLQCFTFMLLAGVWPLNLNIICRQRMIYSGSSILSRSHAFTIQWNFSNQTSKKRLPAENQSTDLRSFFPTWVSKKGKKLLEEKHPIWDANQGHMIWSFRFRPSMDSMTLSPDILLGRGVWRLGSHSTSSSGMARGWGRPGGFPVFRWCCSIFESF